MYYCPNPEFHLAAFLLRLPPRPPWLDRQDHFQRDSTQQIPYSCLSSASDEEKNQPNNGVVTATIRRFVIVVVSVVVALLLLLQLLQLLLELWCRHGFHNRVPRFICTYVSVSRTYILTYIRYHMTCRILCCGQRDSFTSQQRPT